MAARVALLLVAAACELMLPVLLLLQLVPMVLPQTTRRSHLIRLQMCLQECLQLFEGQQLSSEYKEEKLIWCGESVYCSAPNSIINAAAGSHCL